MESIEQLNQQCRLAIEHNDTQGFLANIEILRELALLGEKQAHRCFINWYRELNPAFERIVRSESRYDRALLSLHFKANWLKKRRAVH